MWLRTHARTVGIVAVTAAVVGAGPAAARTVVDYARNAGHLGGLAPGRFAHACGSGTIGGFAQVPGDTASTWSKIDGYGTTLVDKSGTFRCGRHGVLARQVSTGVYLVSFGAGCAGATEPLPTETLPAVVTVNAGVNLVATYTTTCDPNDKGFEERVSITAGDGSPADADFTIEELEPVSYR